MLRSACALILSLSLLGEVGAKVQDLPDLSSASAWQLDSGSTGKGQISSWPGRLMVDFSGKQGQIVNLVLKTSRDVPSWATDLTFVMGNGGSSGRVKVKAIIVDSSGSEFLYNLLEAWPELRSGYPVFKAGFRNVPVRLHAEGLKRPSFQGGWATIESVGGRRSPKPPLKLKGVQLEAGMPDTKAQLSFGDFTWTRLLPRESEFYYAIDGVERFGEVDAVPFITLAELGKSYGGVFDVEWELRDQYAGKPLLRGEKNFRLSTNDPSRPYPLQLEEKIEFPVSRSGTYWITTKLRWGRSEKDFPESVEEKTFRLDVFRSTRPDVALPASPDTPPAIGIAAERPSLIFNQDEPLVIPVSFHSKSPATSYRLSVRPYAGVESIKELSGSLSPGEPLEVPIDLTSAGSGAWIVRAEILDGDKLIDAKERLVGKRAPSASSPLSFDYQPRKDTDPTAGKSLVIMSAQLPDQARDDARQRWEAIQPFLDNVSAVTKTIELPIRWKDIEPLPGIIDWTWLDRVMNAAADRGLKVILDPQFVSLEPLWIPAHVKKNEAGGVFGHKRYVFQGMRVNHWHSPVLRQALLNVVSQMATRYAKHPAMGGYLILTEQPGDFPYTGWFDGYEEETLQDFRQHLKSQWTDIAALNQRWGSKYSDWQAIGVPPSDASDRQRLDWLTFRYQAISDLLLDQARAVRAIDPAGLIQLYGDGLTDEQAQELHQLGVILANGGAHTPELSGLTKASLGPANLQERAEEHSVGRWSAYSPFQLDATLFNMMLGGGQSAHIKMFVRTTSPFSELRQPPFSLDRFEKLLPIWQELRHALAPAREVFVLDNRNARLLEAGGTTYVSFGSSAITRSFLEAQVIAPLANIPVATSGRVLFALTALGTSYETSLSDALVKYVQDGGTLVMTAAAGRQDPDRPTEDWVLLKRFGWEAPAESNPRTDQLLARTIASPLFPQEGQTFALSGPAWKPASTEGMVASFTDGAPAVSWKSFGAGRIVVLWASGLVPPSVVPGSTSLVADIARWAGVSFSSTASDPLLYTSLLKHQSDDIFYGLVYHSSGRQPWGQDGPPLHGQTRWVVPPGDYSVRELITDQDLGTFSAARLLDSGIDSQLKPHAVAVYRLARIQK